MVLPAWSIPPVHQAAFRQINRLSRLREPRNYRVLCQATRGLGRGLRNPVEPTLSTKIDVFGAFQSLLVPNAIEAIRELTSSSRPSPNAPVQLADIMDRALTGTAEDLLERELGDQRERWKNRVTFRHWRGTPDCPACEWTRFDEEQMHRA